MNWHSLAIEAVGWIGAVLALIAFVLVSSGRIQAQSSTFQLLNLFGAAGFVVNTAWHGAIPSMVLNIIWCGIAVFTLLRRRV